MKRNFRVYNKRTYEKKIPYNFPRNNTRITILLYYSLY